MVSSSDSKSASFASESVVGKMAAPGVVVDSMVEEERKMAEKSEQEETKRVQKYAEQSKPDAKEFDVQFAKLEYLLGQSKIYANIMLAKLQKQEEEAETKDAAERKRAEKKKASGTETERRTTRSDGTKSAKQEHADGQGPKKARKGKPPKKTGIISEYFKKEDLQKKAGEALEEEENVQSLSIGAEVFRSARQPASVSGGIMRKYQLEGLEWLASLYENGLNGILADEMGLGKTIQTISLIAFLREKGIPGPYLIVAPLSTLSNWIEEFARWTPDVPTLLYHGMKPERAELRRQRMKDPRTWEFPVICTSYEICMNDQKFLARYDWKYIIIDEGHRLKNLNCRLIRGLKMYKSANRLLITGTPLQNNLTELWSLLNFLMPEIFDTLEAFESWFDFSAVLDKDGHQQIIEQERKSNLIASLHAILKPFLLRRVKSDVESSLPPKREYILYAPLSADQKDLYRAILQGTSREYLESKVFEKLSGGTSTPTRDGNSSAKSIIALKRKAEDMLMEATSNKSAKTSRSTTPTSVSLRPRNAQPTSYKEISDFEFFKQLEAEREESDSNSPEASILTSEDEDRLSTLSNLTLAKQLVAQKRLSNPIMQLRLCCNTAHAFYWPFEPVTQVPASSAALFSASGKLELLHRLLPCLIDAKPAHKVLIFSQFTSVLDIISTSLSLSKKFLHCRIDGSTHQQDRQSQISEFNSPNSNTHIFLLSTRAGGQGINLATADTVVLFDSDWNPQMDLQAIDRAHRIGQTRPVIVYRFATRGTVEETLLERAGGKRRLEKLVIQKGKFKSLIPTSSKVGEDGELEMLRELLIGKDFEDVDVGKSFGQSVLSDEELSMLTDRSSQAYERAKKGAHTGKGFKAVEAGKEEGLLAQVATSQE